MAFIERNKQGELTGYARFDVRLTLDQAKVIEDLAVAAGSPLSGRSQKPQVGWLLTRLVEIGLATYLNDPTPPSTPKEEELISLLENPSPKLLRVLSKLKNLIPSESYEDTVPIESDTIQPNLPLVYSDNTPIESRQHQYFDWAKVGEDHKNVTLTPAQLQKLLLAIAIDPDTPKQETLSADLSRANKKYLEKKPLNYNAGYMSEMLQHFELTGDKQWQWRESGEATPT